METKICTKCKIEKPIENFSIKTCDKRHGICKECHHNYSHSHYINNKQKYLDKARKNDKKKLDFFKEYKRNLICEKCGDKRWYIMEFHHLDPTQKDFDIAIGIRRYGRERVIDEIKKCKILCANCHRELHFLEKALEEDTEYDILSSERGTFA